MGFTRSIRGLCFFTSFEKKASAKQVDRPKLLYFLLYILYSKPQIINTQRVKWMFCGEFHAVHMWVSRTRGVSFTQKDCEFLAVRLKLVSFSRNSVEFLAISIISPQIYWIPLYLLSPCSWKGYLPRNSAWNSPVFTVQRGSPLPDLTWIDVYFLLTGLKINTIQINRLVSRAIQSSFSH